MRISSPRGQCLGSAWGTWGKGTNNILFEAKTLLPCDELCASPTMVNWLPAVQSLKNSHSHTLTCRQAEWLWHSFTYTHAYALTNNHILICGCEHTLTAAGPHCVHTLSYRLGHADALKAFNMIHKWIGVLFSNKILFTNTGCKQDWLWSGTLAL